MTDTKNPIVVLGTGRSGTSVTAGMLFYMGVHMGDKFISADLNNATGHWEDHTFAHLNHEYIIGRVSIEDWKSETKRLIELRQKQAEERDCRWGWKIPASSNILPEYLQLFEEIGIKPDWVISRRPTEEVIKSHLRAYGGSREQWEEVERTRSDMLKKYLIDNEAIENVIILDLEDLIKQPATIAGNLAKDLGLNASDSEKIQASELVNTAEKGAKVMIAIPNMGHIHAELALRLIEWSAHTQGWGTTVAVYAPRNLSPVDHARNQCVKTFLDSDFTHLWFIDADTVPPSMALKSLLKANKDVVTGVTPTFKIHKGEKTPQRTPMVFAFDYGDSSYQMDETAQPVDQLPDKAPLKSVDGVGTQRVDACGASCLMIKREVIEKMALPLFKIRYNEEGIPVQGEDLYFCSSLRDANIPLYCDFNVINYHHKEITM